MTATTSEHPDLRQVWLTVRQVKALTGFALSEIYAALQDGELPGIQRGGRRSHWRIHRDEIDPWVKRRRPRRSART